jgi:lysophospholipase
MISKNGNEKALQGTQREHFLRVADIEVRYVVKQPPRDERRGFVVVLPGYAEFIEKHQTQTDGFAELGFETITIDWPSQGLSTRMARKGHPHLIHSPGYDLNLRVIRSILQVTGAMEGDPPVFFFGHSMGGHWGLRIARDLYRWGEIRPRGVILCSPLIMIKLVPFPRNVLMFVETLCGLGLSKRGVPGSGLRRSSRFRRGNPLTRDPEGYALQYGLFEQNPALRSRGPTYGWVKTMLSSCLQTTRNPKWMSDYEIPIQAHLPGDERVVDGKAAREMLALIPRSEIHVYDKARHELMLELPEVRTAIWERMSLFIDRCIERDDRVVEV